MDRLVTFDCFDTVLTRAVGSPRAVAHVVARQLQRAGLVDVDPGAYQAARRQAEHLLFRRVGDGHTLGDIAVQLADLLGLPPEAAGELERVEVEAERALSRGVPAAAVQVQRERDSGAQVGFLSDTPLEREVVEGLLRTQGLMHDGDLLWVSNGLGAGKERGTAFFEVAHRLGSAPRDWRHVGDDPRADVKMARLSGVTPTWQRRARLNRYEEALETGAASSGGLSSLLAGASRRTRLVLEVEDPELPGARAAVLAGVAGPLLVGYLLWALRQAHRSGCRVVLVGGGGSDAPLTVARRLAGAVGQGVEVRAEADGFPAGEPFARVTTGWSPSSGGPGAAPRSSGDLPRLECHLGVEGPPSPGDGRAVLGYLADAVRGTGVGARREDVEASLALLVAPRGDRATEELRRVLDVFCDELLPVLPVMDHGGDVRVPTWEALRCFWDRPTEQEARAFASCAADGARSWPAGRRLVAPAVHQAWYRAVGRAAALGRKAARARYFADGRRAARR